MAQITLNSSGVASNGTLALQSNGTTTAVTIDASQNVGIGTGSPSQTLHLKSETSANAVFEDTTSGIAGYVGPSANNQTDTTATRLGIRGEAGISFSVGSPTKMTLDASGNLLVGKTNADEQNVGNVLGAAGDSYFTRSGTTNSSSTLHVYSTGASAFRFFVGLGGTVYATNTAISSLSDQRHKENIRDLNVGLDKIMALKPRLFDWKEGKGQDIKNARGFIAQEFEEVFPDLIDEWKDPAPEGEEPYKSVRADLIPVLVKAIQEQQALITTLTQRITALEAK